MKALLALALLSSTALADGTATPSKTRKEVPKQILKAAADRFATAAAFDEKGDLDRATKEYRRAFETSPHPAAAFNLGDVQERNGRFDDAINSFTMYLTLDPKATDRKAVLARIAAMRAKPTQLLFPDKSGDDDRYNESEIELEKSYIFIDGKMMVKEGAKEQPHVDGMAWPGIVIDVPYGKHVADVVSAVSYGWDDCNTIPGTHDICTPRVPLTAPGNTMISATDREIDVMIDSDYESKTLVHQRFDLKPGKHVLRVTDHGYECAPIVVEGTKGDDVRFVFLATSEGKDLDRCRALSVTQQVLHFE